MATGPTAVLLPTGAVFACLGERRPRTLIALHGLFSRLLLFQG